jgi:hypothetical protein
VTIVFILVATTVFAMSAAFGNLLRFLGADPTQLERAPRSG